MTQQPNSETTRCSALLPIADVLPPRTADIVFLLLVLNKRIEDVADILSISTQHIETILREAGLQHICDAINNFNLNQGPPSDIETAVSAWIQAHPDLPYSKHTCPHLCNGCKGQIGVSPPHEH